MGGRTLRMLHCAGYLRSLGGVQSVLRDHLARDPADGVDSRQVIFFERDDPARPAVTALGWDWRWTIRRMRGSFGQVTPPLAGRVSAYYDLWGMAFLADLDRAGRRLGCLYNNPPGMESIIRAQRGRVDGLMAVSRALVEMATRLLPELGPERVRLLPLPVQAPADEAEHAPLANRPLVLGYSGRLVRSQKRVDRFPEFVGELNRLRVPYRLEFLGEGREGPWLRQQLDREPNVVFHGSKSGAEYWRILSSWDASICVSDFEGTPISVVEGMCRGVLPVFPRIPSDAVAYASGLGMDLVYEPGDMAAAARAVDGLRRRTPREWAEARARATDPVRPHLGRAYFDGFHRFAAELEELPRLSETVSAPRPPFWTDFLPLGLLARFVPSGLWRR